MKALIPAAAVMTLLAAAPARADERIGEAGLGALAGAVVAGPIGLVAGAVVGYAAGPAITRSWRANRNLPRQSVQKPKRRPAVMAEAKQRRPAAVAGEVTPAPGVGGPPAQGLE